MIELTEEQQRQDDDKNFYRDMLKELINISKVNSENVRENNKIVQELSINISELKLSLQNKPCLLGKL